MTQRKLVLVLTASLHAAGAAAQTPDFGRDVLPIFDASCTVCHGPDLQESRLRLDSEQAALEGGMSGAVVVPGDSKQSPLIGRLTGSIEPAMPMGGEPLSAEELATVRAWIDSIERVVPLERASEHWAYVKPVEPPLPAVGDATWPRNPIDRFVLAALEDEGLAPSEEADRATFHTAYRYQKRDFRLTDLYGNVITKLVE